MKPRLALSTPDVHRVAGLAAADPRTVKRYLDGRPMRPCTRRAVAEAIAALGLDGPRIAAVRVASADPVAALLRAAGDDRG